MNIEKLFQVIVAMGASSTVGLAACSSSTSGGTGGSSSDDSGATEPTDGSKGGTDAASGGDASSCNAVCHADPQVATWVDCNGCCCWLPAGSTSPGSTPICGAEPCCAGHGR